MISRSELEKTKSLEEAVAMMFGIKNGGRTFILTDELMEGNAAIEYDSLGKIHRQGTYARLVEDFKNRTGCYGVSHQGIGMDVGIIVDIGCGSGLLSLELAEKTTGKIIGIDLSSDMVKLAEANLADYSRKKADNIRTLWKSAPECFNLTSECYESLETGHSQLYNVNFIESSVYDIRSALAGAKDVNYIVCRNALHRFKDPAKAIKEMYGALSPGGKIYIRDVKRDADWNVVLSRIGEERWKSSSLVIDYVAAMAAALTESEVAGILDGMGIKDYFIDSGRHIASTEDVVKNIAEFEKEVEYVCVITK